ncbi:interferon alpha-inducible protein 27-like protein 2A isoform X3 [Microcaecilia unicolor]|uniref:Interferon alpha-inducible protein 27-like protein 2A isoform X3 n=1 Tax=Microcaecilia unicolor TaxID=1415580 RepID=A0A6P7ZFW6_9AMPH|nr:interferon alpha-inducible protein 27-like protein 2A isoform X3 [Microcaecilia unicolor]
MLPFSRILQAAAWRDTISVVNPKDKDQTLNETAGKELELEAFKTTMKTVSILGIAGAVTAVVGTPVVIGMVGFTSAGIAAGSLAAKMMSAAALANGGGVAAGGTVAVLQSIGAAGFSVAAKATLGTIGAGAGATLGAALKKLF